MSKKIEVPMHEFESGAKSSVVEPRYDLVPLAADKYMAIRFAYGAGKHGEWNWEKGAEDPEWIRDRKNHAIKHMRRYINGRLPQDQLIKELQAAACNIAILCAIEDMKSGGDKEGLA